MGSACSNLLTCIQWQHRNAHMPSAAHWLISGLSSQIPKPLFRLMLTLGRRPSRLPYRGAMQFVFFFPSPLGLGLMLTTRRFQQQDCSSHQSLLCLNMSTANIFSSLNHLPAEIYSHKWLIGFQKRLIDLSCNTQVTL